MIEECQGTAVVLDRDCHGITVSANVIAHNFGGGVDLRDAWGCAISANTFTVDEVRAVVVGPHSGRITITGNNFSDRYIGEGKYRSNSDDPAAGIHLAGAIVHYYGTLVMNLGFIYDAATVWSKLYIFII